MRYLVILFSFFTTFSTSCSEKESGKINELRKEKEAQFDSIKRVKNLEGLSSLYDHIVSKDKLDTNFYREIRSMKIYPLSFALWRKYDQKKFDETVILVFLKMFHKDISPYESDITYQAETNSYLTFMIYCFYENQIKDPEVTILLGDVAKTIIDDNMFKKNAEIKKEMQRIRKEWNYYK